MSYPSSPERDPQPGHDREEGTHSAESSKTVRRQDGQQHSPSVGPAGSNGEASDSWPSRSSEKPGNRPKGPLVGAGVGGLVLGLVLGSITTAALMRSGDGEGADPSASPDSVTSSSAAPAAGDSPEERDFPGLNEPAVGDGATVTVIRVDQGGTAPMMSDSYRDQPGPPTQAATAQKLVSVVTEIENTGKHPWDLTCGGSVQGTMFDKEERAFNAIRDLRLIPGNPECNGSTQPGQKVPMTWMYEVPVDVNPRFFGFRVSGMLTGEPDATLTGVDLSR